MTKNSILLAIGVCGLFVTSIQTHAIDPYMTIAYRFVGLKTEAQELVLTGKLLASLNTDSVLERTSVQTKKQFSSESEQKAKQMRVWATAYTSHPMETDDTPFVTASGSTVRDGVVASNFLPMGTKFMIPNHYGDKVFVVEDRMNARYNDKKTVDIWFESRTDALQFGRRSLVVELL